MENSDDNNISVAQTWSDVLYLRGKHARAALPKEILNVEELPIAQLNNAATTEQS